MASGTPISPGRRAATNAGKAVQVAEAIRARIASGQLKGGDALAPEPVLMSEFAVSQPTMRAALRILESEGLIRIQRGAGGGPRVQELDVGVLARSAGLYLQVEGADLADLLESLLVLQPGAVRLAARRRTPEQLERLRDCERRAGASCTMGDFVEAATDFVLLLLEASGNQSIKLFSLVIGSLIRSELHKYLDLRLETATARRTASRFGELIDLLAAREGETAAAYWLAYLLMVIPPDLRRPRT